MLYKFQRQLGVLLWKNLLLRFRHWHRTLFEGVICPIVFVSTIALLQNLSRIHSDAFQDSLENTPIKSNILNGVPRCESAFSGVAAGCVTLFYSEPDYAQLPIEEIFQWSSSYNTTVYDGIIREFVYLNNLRLFAGSPLRFENFTVQDSLFIPSGELGVVKISSADVLYSYVLQQPNTTSYAITFNAHDTETLNIEYTVWYNSTSNMESFGTALSDGVLAVLRGIDEAIISYLNGAAATKPHLNVTLRNWPTVTLDQAPDIVVQTIGATFLFCSMMQIFASFLAQLVSEKESGYRQMMGCMGLLSSAYFISHFIVVTVVIAISSAIITVFGSLVYSFESFGETSTLIMAVSLFTFGEALMAMALFISCFIKHEAHAAGLTASLLVAGAVMLGFVFSGQSFGYIWWIEDNATSQILRKSLVLIFPVFNFGKLWLDINTLTIGKPNSLTGSYVKGPGLNSFGALYNHVPTNLLPQYSANTVPKVPPPIDSLKHLAYNIALFYCAALVLDWLLPVASFPSNLQKWLRKVKFWIVSSISSANQLNANSNVTLLGSSQAIQVDLLSKEESDTILDIDNVSKVHNRVSVLNSFSLSLKSPVVFALLGKSGAGKSTIIEVMLIPDMTAVENLIFYRGIKLCNEYMGRSQLVELLKEVQLEAVADDFVSTFSGGMKRRLSLVLSAISNPRILILDEPTTGLDMKTKLQVQKYICNNLRKKTRIIIITTHDMEEAELLASDVGILSHGKLIARGTPHQLKSESLRTFVGVRRISIVVKKGVDARMLTELMRSNGATILKMTEKKSSTENFFVYYVRFESVGIVVKFLQESDIIKSWGISKLKMEDVFLNSIQNDQ